MAKAKKKTAGKTAKKAASKKAKPATKKTAPKTAARNKTKGAAKKASPKPSKSPAKKAAPVAKSVVSKPKFAVIKGGGGDLSDLLTPLDDRIVVRLTDAERKTAGGLFIPDTVSDVSGNLQGKVVAVGRGHRSKKGHLRPLDLKVGDRVVFSEYAGSKIQVRNEDLVILRESEVMGVIA